jgi:hypothetical protein
MTGARRIDVEADDVMISLSGVALAAGQPSQREQAGRLLDLLMARPALQPLTAWLGGGRHVLRARFGDIACGVGRRPICSRRPAGALSAWAS